MNSFLIFLLLLFLGDAVVLSQRYNILYSDDLLRDGVLGPRDETTQYCLDLPWFGDLNCSDAKALLYYRGDGLPDFPARYGLNASLQVAGPNANILATNWSTFVDPGTPWFTSLRIALVTQHKFWLGAKKRCQEWSVNLQCQNGGIFYSDETLNQEDLAKCGTEKSMVCVCFNGIPVGTPGPTTPQPSTAPTTSQPSRTPTHFPTVSPSTAPSRSPTTSQPSQTPTTSAPSTSPSNAPSQAPTRLWELSGPTLSGQLVDVSGNGLTMVASTSPGSTNTTNVYTRSGSRRRMLTSGSFTTWTLQHTLSGGANKVAVADDGLAFVVCRLRYAAVFRYQVGSWVEYRISGSSRTPSYGTSCDISGDGQSAVVGDDDFQAPSSSETGQVFVFRFNGTTYLQLGTELIGSSRHGVDELYRGEDVSISRDGNTVAYCATLGDHSGMWIQHHVGSGVWVEDTSFPTNWTCSVVSLSADASSVLYVEYRTGNVNYMVKSGSTWTNTDLGFYANSLQLSEDNLYFVAGQPSVGPYGGMVVYEWRSPGVWIQNSNVRTGFPAATGQGVSVSVSGQGYTAVSGSTGGSVYTWEFGRTHLPTQ